MTRERALQLLARRVDEAVTFARTVGLDTEVIGLARVAANLRAESVRELESFAALPDEGDD